MKRTLTLFAGLALLLVLFIGIWQRAASAAVQSGGGYDIGWSVMGSAGDTFASGGDYQVGFTLAQDQESVISSDGGAYQVVGGFWRGAEAAPQDDYLVYLPLVLADDG